MPDSMNNDVVGARISLDTSKIAAAFKVIDQGIKQNANIFKALNSELAITEKSYASLAKAMDKIVLSSDERKKKIMDESNALVEQRKAQTELLQAKKSQLDATNQIVDSKLQTQKAIQKKHEDAMLQQEQRHQQQMVTLQQKTIAASGQENLVQAKIDRQFQIMRNGDIKLEMEMERHAAKMQQLNKQSINLFDNAPSTSTGFFDKIGLYAEHALVFHTITRALSEATHTLKEGLVDIESNMAGYVQTNEKYFVTYNNGTHEMVKNTERINEETTKFLETTHALGSNIMDVTESARLWGRMYKDVGIVQEMVKQSTKLSTVDLVELEKATKITESTIAQYGVQIRNVNDAQVQGNRILDSWSKVAHDTMAPARDLGAAFERTGKIANETGVSFDFMNGLISAGIRNTALSGENLGNMWKTVLGTIRTDKAVKEIESLGVATKEVVNGTEEWRKAEDILLDLSVKVIDKNYDLTQSYADISRGVYQYAKLAASLNVGDILLGQSASINSTNATLEYLNVQMDTIQRKAAQTKASLLEIFNRAGDDGLRTMIKGSLDILDSLLLGISKVPKGVFEATASIAGLIALYKLVGQPLMAWRSAEVALTSAIQMHTVTQAAATEQMVIYSAAAANTARMTAMATMGISAIVGILSIYLLSLGEVEQKERRLSEQRERKISVMEQEYSQIGRQVEFLPKLVNVHNELQKQLDSGSLSVEKQTTVKEQLDKVSKALKQTIGDEGLAQLQAAKYTDEATGKIIESLNKRRAAVKQSILDDLNLQNGDLEKKIKDAQEKANKASEKVKNPSIKDYVFQALNLFGKPDFKQPERDLEKANTELDNLKNQQRDLEQKRVDVETSLLEITMQGVEGKRLKDQADYDSIKDSFKSDYDQFKHLVAMKADGYKTAEEQADKLAQIKNKYINKLNDVDLWGVEEDLVRIREGNGKVVDGGKTTKAPKASFSISLIDTQIKQAESLVDSADSLINFYQAKSGALSSAVDDTATKIELYTNRQNKLHEANEVLRGSLVSLAERQTALNALYSQGKITVDDYNRYSEDLQNRFTSINKSIDKNSSAWWDNARAIKEAKEQQLQASFDFSSEWIRHMKAIGQLSAEEELAAWQRVQARYLEGTEQRKRADEQVFAAKKALMQEEEKKQDDLYKTLKTNLEEAKKAELKSIQDARDAYVDAQDEKIRALERLIAAEQDKNDDDDYEKSLAEKKARAKLLEDAVGPEGKKERRDLLKEIEKMELDHTRTLRKRDLESQKQTLQDEKREKEKAFEQEKKDVEARYEELAKSFESFKGDIQTIEEAIKKSRINSNQEANKQILTDLEEFVKNYKSKLAETTAAEIDLKKYNSNKDKWAEAAANGDTSEMARLNERNEELRKKYGIDKDTGKLQHFADGGVVRGIKNQPVPIVAHAGEMFLNEGQQANLFKLLNFSMPKMNFTMPVFDFPKSSMQHVTNYFTISSGDVNLHDQADIRTYFNERDSFIKRTESRAGVKQR